ncbi:hypothetical protein BGZ76_010493 [Entomortierella beljakovae]|nr:hypothetical protein BGZ76_010493 [Entomortierella beljakovae]
MIPSNQLHNHSDNASLSLDSWIYSLFSSCSDAIIACDLNGNICSWNQGAQYIFGISPKQSLGKNLNRLLNSVSAVHNPAQSPPTSVALAASAVVAAPSALTPSSIPSDPELYPSTPEMVQALKGSSIKRIISRTTQDQTQHQFLESISAIYEQRPASLVEPLINSHTSISNSNDTKSNNKPSNADSNTASSANNNNNNNNSHHNINYANNNSIAHTEPNGRHHSHINDMSTPALVGYSVILTDLSTLPTFPTSSLPYPQSPQPHAPISAAPAPLPSAPLPSAPLPSAQSLDKSQAVSTKTNSVQATTATVTASTMTTSAAAETSEPTVAQPIVVIDDKDDRDDKSGQEKPPINGTENTPRPTTTREYSTDSGFDERTLAPKSTLAVTVATTKAAAATTTTTEAAAVVAAAAVAATTSTTTSANPTSTSITSTAPTATNDANFVHMPRLQFPSDLDLLYLPDIVSEPLSILPPSVELTPNNRVIDSKISLPTSRSNSISLPVGGLKSNSSHPELGARSSSLSQLTTLSALSAFRPRALSIAATAVSHTSTGIPLSVSMSSSHDKSRLDIRHNSLNLSSLQISPLSGESRQEREWDDPFLTYLAPIATSLLTCQGEHFFDIVVEELAINLGVKYGFISQLVSLDELKELDPTEYANLIEQFGGIVPPIDGVMHNISSWPGESSINPHAFQGYLADCTIQDKVTFLDAHLAEKHHDVAECLNDYTIESYVGMRLETTQGEIVGVIGIIHDKQLTEEDGLIVRAVLEQVGARVANELDRLKVEANLIYARDVAESTAKNKTKFLADMSHEIRNPMNAVVGVTDILLDTVGLSEEQTSYIEVIRTSGQHLLTVINDILDISRIDQDVKFLLERRPLSLHKCLKDAVSLAGLTPLHDVSRSISVIEWPPEMDDIGPFSELEETNILPLLWSIDNDVPEHLLGDITRLRQVLINLCTNSLKFTQRGRVAVHVSIHTPTAQHPTIRPNSSPMVTRNTSNISNYQPRSDLESFVSPSSSPMLTGADVRAPMVFEQRYDVKADGGHIPHAKVPASRRRQADKRYVPFSTLPSSNSENHIGSSSSSSSTPPSLTVVAPTANSLAGDNMDENTVILEFAVSDTGVGIPANKITELFTSFSQVDISVSTRFGGTGLGLAISASLVEKMGGNIWVESTEGVGSRFTFTIPFTVCQSSETESHPSATAPSSPILTPKKAEPVDFDINLDSPQLPVVVTAPVETKQKENVEQKEEIVVETIVLNVDTQVASASTSLSVSTASASTPASTSISTSTSTSTSISTSVELSAHAEITKPASPTYAKVVESTMKPLMIDGAPLRILLAEDNSVNQKIAVGVLKKLGYDNVDVAENGLEVIDKLDHGKIYDVILMDVSMPVMDGIDATRAIVDRRKRKLLNTWENVEAGILQSDRHNESDSSMHAAAMENLNLYVIALTASAMGSDKERCMEAGMDDFMTKPFVVLEMKRVLNEFIERRNSGVLKSRNDACLVSALAIKSRCNSPNCQGGVAALKDLGRSLTPTLGRSSSSSSNTSLTEVGATECAGCGGAVVNAGDSSAENVPSSPNSNQGRTCRMETPRPLRRNLDSLSCSLFTGRRSQDSNGYVSSALGGPISLESANFGRRASDALFFSKREWRSGLGMSCEPSSSTDIHPFDDSAINKGGDHDLGSEGTNSNGSIHLSSTKVKRVVSPSGLSRSHDHLSIKPMASPLSPLSLLTTDTEGSSTISPPLSSSSTSSPTEAVPSSNEADTIKNPTITEPTSPSSSAGL